MSYILIYQDWESQSYTFFDTERELIEFCEARFAGSEDFQILEIIKGTTLKWEPAQKIKSINVK